MALRLVCVVWSGRRGGGGEMDILKAEIERKRKLMEEKELVAVREGKMRRYHEGIGRGERTGRRLPEKGAGKEGRPHEMRK